MYAIVEISGFDYKVKPGDRISVPHQDAKEGTELEFTNVKLYNNDKKLDFSPKVKVKTKVLGHHRGKKVLVYKFKKRKGYRRKIGYRDTLTDLEVTAINAAEAKKTASAKASGDKSTEGKASSSGK